MRTNFLWKPICQELESFKDLSEDVRETPKPTGYWKMWYNSNVPIKITLQAPLYEEWDTGKEKKNIRVPTVGTLLQRDIIQTTPAGVIITSNSFYVCTEINFYSKGRNKGLPKTLQIAKDIDLEHQYLEHFTEIKSVKFALSSRQEINFSSKGFMQKGFNVISQQDVYS